MSAQAYMCVDGAGQIVETGVIDSELWERAPLMRAGWTRHPIAHEAKLAIEGSGHRRFYATSEIQEHLPSFMSLDGLAIYYKDEVSLLASRAEFGTDEEITVMHSGPVPLKLWAGLRPVAGSAGGRCHPQGHPFSASVPGRYTITLRDPRYWAEPLEVRAVTQGDH